MSCIASPTIAAPSQNKDSVTVPSNIDELSARFHVDADELRAEIEKQANSPVFSPFSAIKVYDDGIEASTTISETAPDWAEELFRREKDEASATAANALWYNQYNQDSTAYLATGNRTASGVWPAVGMCAVHRYSNGTPYINFGTTVYLDGPATPDILIQGVYYYAFDVQDTGDANFVRSTYWLDFYFGNNTSANQTAALNYGVRKIGYGYYQ